MSTRFCYLSLSDTGPLGSEDTLPDAKDANNQDLPKKTKKRIDWNGSWFWEIGGALFSVLCMTLLVIFLKYVDGSDYNDWQYSVSPNAIASVIVTVAKSATLIPVSACLSQLNWNQKQYGTPMPLYRMQILDNASRGPLGAFQVFSRVTPGLATMGAALMILSVAVDPFAQQILTFPSREVQALNETAYTHSTHEYMPGWQTDDWRAGVQYYLSGYEVEPTLQVAILSGLSGTYRPLEPTCPSGTCDYPDFVTLGICSECKDVTKVSQQTCRSPGIFKWVQEDGGDTSLTTFPDGEWINSIHSHCTYSSPTGFNITPGWMKPSVSSESTTLYRQPWTSIVTSDTTTWRGSQSPLASFFAVKYEGALYYTKDNLTKPEPKPTLSECSVYWCERAYKKNHVTPHQRTLQTTRSQKLYSKGPQIDNSHPRYLVPFNGKATLSENPLYRISQLSFDVLQPLMASFFNSTLIQRNMDTRKVPGLQPALLLWNSKNISHSMDDMATSMSDHFRSDGDAVLISGRVFVNNTFIHVRWPWIILPIAMVILSVFLLVSTAVASERLHAVLWKSSLLPLIAGHLKTQPGRDLGSVGDVDDMVDISKKIFVVMESQKPPVFSER